MTRARILAVGDLLMHIPVVKAAALPEGEWDFKPIFEPVQPWIEEADLAIANLETTLTGDRYPFSGYPRFNTPPALARDVKAVGFDVITTANNHCLDYGLYGLTQTAEALDQYGLLHTGTNRTPEEREQILTVEAAPGLNIAILAYTYGTNGLPLPYPWSVNLLDPDRIRSDIEKARMMPEVDLVAVALHMGVEYAREPSPQQDTYVQLALDAGADIVLGNHPHVIQKAEIRRVVDQFGRDRPRAVIYSLGNFISNQSGLYKEAGLLFLVDVMEGPDGASVENVSFIPTWVHRYVEDGRTRYRVVAVEEAIRAYETQTDPLLTAADYQRLKEVWADTTVQAAGDPAVRVMELETMVVAE